MESKQQNDTWGWKLEPLRLFPQATLHGTSTPTATTPRRVTSQPALISSWGIKANIFLIDADLEWGADTGGLTERLDAASCHLNGALSPICGC